MAWAGRSLEREEGIYQGIDPVLLRQLEQQTRAVHRKQLEWVTRSCVTRWSWPRKQIYPIASDGRLSGTVYTIGDGPFTSMLRWWQETYRSCQRQSALGYIATDRVFVGSAGPELSLVPMLVTMLYVFEPQRRCGYRIEQQLVQTSDGGVIQAPMIGTRVREGDQWVWTEGSSYPELQQPWPIPLR